MGTDHDRTFDPFKQFGIFGIAFLIINAVLLVSTLIFFYLYKVYQLSLQHYICREGVHYSEIWKTCVWKWYKNIYFSELYGFDEDKLLVLFYTITLLFQFMGLGLVTVGAQALNELSKINSENTKPLLELDSVQAVVMVTTVLTLGAFGLGIAGAYLKKKFILLQVSINQW